MGVAPLQQLSMGELNGAVADGAGIVDVRSFEAFGSGHGPGSVSMPWRGQFATWLGWLIPRGEPVLVVATTPSTALTWCERSTPSATSGSPGSSSAASTHGKAPTGNSSASRWSPPTRRPIGGCPAPGSAPSTQRGTCPARCTSRFGELSESVEAVPDGPVLVHYGHGERAISTASLLERAVRRDVAVLARDREDLGELESDI